MANVVMATSTCHVGETLMLNEGELWAADDPFVLARPELFTDDLESVTRRSVKPAKAATPVEAPVEQATAAPGEKRQTRRPS